MQIKIKQYFTTINHEQQEFTWEKQEEKFITKHTYNNL